jgi:predicted NUDIX family phosphoesterase
VTPEELVLVVPRAAVIPGRGWRGVRGAELEAFLALVKRDGSFRPRGEMEHDEAFKQVIPYVVLRDRGAYFLMRRTRAGGDRRLHDRWSIGIGGHVNPEDGSVHQGLRREWSEELDATFIPEFRFVGLLNDDETDVGRVHIGVVFEAEAAGRRVTIRETEKLDGRFAQRSEVAATVEAMESWSGLAFEHLETMPPR